MSPTTTLLLIFAAACSSLLLVSSRKVDTNREALVQSAIAEVKHEFSSLHKAKLSKSQAKLHAFKKASPEALAQGLARLKFERMVKLAEKKILRSRRLATAQTTSSMAEALATELLHKPGSILTSQEIAKIYQESDCFETLPTPTNCNTPAAKFHRTPDGSCNNREHLTLGAANTRMRRLIAARYDDGISRPKGFLQSQDSELFRAGVFGAPHPSARVASTAIVRDREDNDTTHTHMMMQWGQFMDHDFSAMPEFEEECECEVSDETEGSCYPFRIPEDDDGVTRTESEDIQCFLFHRSVPVCPEPEMINEVPPREQINSITHWVDGSNVYGHSADILNNELRDLESSAGLLKVGPPASEGGSRPLLPDAALDSFVLCPEGTEPCFVAGDFRVNEQSGLTVMHTIWVREHNRIAQSISDNNPSFTSTKVFLTAREIVTAEIQKITYQDFLPLLIGDMFTDLIPPYVGDSSYNPEIDPSIPNSFATAAYRYGHSQIQPFFERLGADYESIPAGPLALVDAFFDTSHVRQFGTDPLVRGLLAKPARRVDEFLNSILTNQLFADDATSPGLDLASLNIQRGRDHGTPGYLTWKQWAKDRCKVESEFRNELTEIYLLQTYGSLESVDLFVGGLSEQPLPGGLVGAVFACIFAQTLVPLRDGDRFYYENTNSETALFSPEQIATLNQASLSRVLCDTTDITEIQTNAFLANQPRVPCSQLPSVDLSLWNQAMLPDMCFMKVESVEAGTYFAVSRRTTESRFHFHNEPIGANDAVCYPVLCPGEGGETILAVVSRQNVRCAPTRNPNLPEPTGGPVNTYIGQLDVDDFTSGTNGIYTDLGTCEGGSRIEALTYECAKRHVSSQDGTNMANTDIDTDSSDRIRELVGNDEVSNEIIGGGSVSNEEKLVRLMEEVIKELKTNSQEEPVKKHKKKAKTAADVPSENNLVSELEKMMKELE